MHFFINLQNTLSRAVGLALLVQCLCSVGTRADDRKVIVYYGTNKPAKEREKILNNNLGKDSVVVFGRSKEFIQTMDDSSIPIVIAPVSFEELHKNYEPVFQLLISGKKDFEYRVITSGKNINLKKIDSITFGMIEEIDRKNLKTFFANIVGIKVEKIKTVSKAEDLFPMLAFAAADAVIVAENDLEELKKDFTASIEIAKIHLNRVQFPRVYIKKGEKYEEILKKIEGLSPSDLKALGFDSIERITND